MSNHRKRALAYFEDHKEEIIEKLTSFISIPSVSTDPEHAEDIKEAAQWLKKELTDLGMEDVEVHPTPKHPIVFGQKTDAGEDAFTILIYGHYDVQPEDPVDEWDTEPFTPTLKGEELYGRGATDMKGQVIAALSAVQAIMETGDLPLNVKILIEGEEEIGGPNLGNFIQNHREMLACDFALNPDTGMLAPDLPTITYALRGLAYFELRIFGPKQDLHSGLFGGAVHNPAQVLCDLIAAMHDEKGKVTLPGFYEDVLPLEEEEREELDRLPLDETFYLEQTGAPALWGEEGYTPIERVGARPTLEINGLYSGFIGEGSKTVLPSYAMAKISTRLVPEQDPARVGEQLEQFLAENAPASVDWELNQLASSPASLSDRSSPWVKAYANAAETVWGKRPLFKREGGSVPVVGEFQEYLGVDSVNIGFGLPTDNLHGPNEKLHLPTFKNGIRTLIHFFFNLRR